MALEVLGTPWDTLSPLVRSILTRDGHNKLRLFELDVKEKKKETIGKRPILILLSLSRKLIGIGLYR